MKLRLNKSNYNHGREQCPDKLILLSTVHFLEWTVISCFSRTDVWIKKINKGDLDICSNSLTNVWVIKKKIHKWKKKPIKNQMYGLLKKIKSSITLGVDLIIIFIILKVMYGSDVYHGIYFSMPHLYVMDLTCSWFLTKK